MTVWISLLGNFRIDMMKEARLSNTQKKGLVRSVHDIGSLPQRVRGQCSILSSNKEQKARANSKNTLAASSTSRLRNKEVIEQSGAYERPQYIGSEPSNYEKEKEKFVNRLAYGCNFSPEDVQVVAKESQRPLEEINDGLRISELTMEVEERKNFLTEMETIGMGKKYRNIILGEISQEKYLLNGVEAKIGLSPARDGSSCSRSKANANRCR